MKRIKLILGLTILSGFFACEPAVTFNEPQPTNTKNLNNFPSHLHGEYFSLADNSTLSINDKIIQRIYDIDYRIHPSELDSTTILSGDSIINLTTNEKTPIKRDGDSLMYHVHFIDTLFQMDYDNVVRKFKGFYFLNIRYDKTSWEVKKIRLTKNQLEISSISTKEEIQNLKEITETTTDTISPYKFTASKRAFKKFLKNSGFSESEIFIRKK